MRKYYLIVIAFIILLPFANSQTVTRKYLKSPYSDKEIEKEKAKFLKTIILNIDNSETTEMKDLSKNEVIRSETYKGEEPYGSWKIPYNSSYKELDYNFDLNYNGAKCPEDNFSDKRIQNYFENNDSVGYKAPIISSESNINKYIWKNLIYPSKAKEEGISGKVYLKFTITKNAEIKDLSVVKGANVLLDKESVRIIRELRLSSPPTFNGEPKEICVTLPLTFRLL